MNRTPGSGGTLLRALAAAMAAACVLAGCSSAGPSDLETPEVVWPDGEPAGEFEDDPAVIALREAHVQEAIAWNASDYSDPDFVYRWGFPLKPFVEIEAPARVASERITDGRSKPREWTMLGPVPMTIYEVQAGRDSALVTACLGPQFLQYDAVTGEPTDSRNEFEQFEVEFFPDGSSAVSSVVTEDRYSGDHFERCKSDSPVRGVFDPEPELFDGDADDIKYPAPAEEYGFDSVS